MKEEKIFDGSRQRPLSKPIKVEEDQAAKRI